jgi:hypothetical protein
MISSVTSATSSTVTTAAGVVAALGLAATIGLIVFLTTKELSPATETGRFGAFRRNLTIAVIPLLLVFATIVIMKVVEVL